MPKEIIIIGAGIAGLSAAAKLGKAGFVVTLVEARDRIGGRMFTKHDPSCNAAVELGAEFIHGKPNEIWDLVRSNHLDTTEMDGDNWCLRNGELSTCDFFSEVDEILEKMDEHSPDISFTDFLQQCCPTDDSAKQWALGYVQGFHAADPKLVSVHSLVKGTRADEAIEGDRGFRIQGGYAALLQVLERQLRELDIVPRLNTVVDHISWKPGKVEVSARDASGSVRLVADAALISLPLGVLQAKAGQPGAVNFVPELPAIKQDALQHLVMGHVIRVTLCFRERFWKDLLPPHSKQSKTLDHMGFLLSRDEWFPTWWTRVPEELPLIVGWAPFPSADKLSGKTEGFVVDKALEALARLLELEKNQLASLLTAAYTYDWQSDPFSRGAYSYVKVGGDTAEHDLGVPLDSTLFFAGEATEVTGHNGTVHGAIASGKRAATEIIKTFR